MKYVIILVSFWGCCAGGVERIATFRFSEYEENLIPYTSNSIVEYISENNTIYEARANKLNSYQSATTEACEEVAYEYASSSIEYNDLSYIIDIRLENRIGTDFFLRASFYDVSGEIAEDDYLVLEDREAGRPLEDYPRDVVINGETYSKVFVFENPKTDGKTKRILYSPMNGIEYVEWDENKYLKLFN